MLTSEVTDIGQLASLARTALDDPESLPEDDANAQHARHMEGKAVLTSDDPFVLYAIDRLDDIIRITDPGYEDRAVFVHSMSALGAGLARIHARIEALTPDTEPPDTEHYEVAACNLALGLDAIDEAIAAMQPDEEDEPYECEDCSVNGEDCPTHGPAYRAARLAIQESPARVMAALRNAGFSGV